MIELKNKVFWAWNGKIEKEEIKSQLRGFKEQGIGGFFIHARCGLETPYFGDEWFDAIKTALEEAKVLGLEVWLYDEDGWPSGFAGGKVPNLGNKYRLKKLKFSFSSDYSSSKLCGYVMAKDGYRLADKDESADVTALIEYDPHYSDLLEPMVTEAFIESTHEVYKRHFGKYFGNLIKGIFTDEPQLDTAVSWSKTLSDRYAAQWQRSYEEDLKYVFSGSADERYQFRTRYLISLYKCFRNSYTDKIEKWCEKNNLLFTGHFPDEDGLLGQSEKAGDVAYHYAGMKYPSIDFLGKRLISPVPLRTISSTAEQYGIKNILCETFGCGGWNEKFADFLWIWGYQAAFGINSACLHLSAYSLTGNKKRDYPGFFSYQTPWFSKFHYLNDKMERINRFVSYGKRNGKTLVLSALIDACAHEKDSAEARRISNQYRVLLESLEDLQIDYDVGDELILKEIGKAENSTLTVGEKKYDLIIVPSENSILSSTYEILKTFVDSGGTVLFTERIPECCDAKPDERFKTLAKSCALPFNGVVQNKKSLWRKVFQFLGRKETVSLRAVNGDTVSDVRMRVTSVDSRFHIFLQNISVSDKKNFFIETDMCKEMREFFLDNGESAELKTNSSETGAYALVTLLPMQAKAFVFDLTDGGRSNALQKAEDVKKVANETKNSEIIKANYLRGYLTDENTFTIDKCSYALDESEYSNEGYVLDIQRKVFELGTKIKEKRKVKLKYTFYNYSLAFPEIYAETDKVNSITLNGIEAFSTGDFFLDKGIKKISLKAVAGKNELILAMYLEPMENPLDISKAFESERNRFSFQTPVEAVYVRGAFRVTPLSNAEDKGKYISVENKGFQLTEWGDLDFSKSITEQGFWFYSGSFIKEYSFNKSGKGKTFIYSEDLRCVVAEVKINGKEAGILTLAEENLDISKFTAEGRNEVAVRFYGSNRNVFGPHHHDKGEANFTGQDTFSGTYGWEDEIISADRRVCTYTPRYSFVELGGGEIYIVSFKE